jgi:hypothetical protein
MQRLCQIVFAFVLSTAASAPFQQGEAAQPLSTMAGKEIANTKDTVKPEIQRTEFGSITIGGTVYRHDVLIRLDGRVEKRKKRLSNQNTGTSHIVSLDEAGQIYQEGAVRLIVGTGQSGMVKLSEEAADYFKRRGCSVELLPTPAAIGVWNQAKGAVIGLFHVTC